MKTGGYNPILFQQPKFEGRVSEAKDKAKNKVTRTKQRAELKAQDLKHDPLAKAAGTSAVISGVGTLMLSGGALLPAAIMAGVGAGATVGLNKARTNMVWPRTKAKLSALKDKLKR